MANVKPKQSSDISPVSVKRFKLERTMHQYFPTVKSKKTINHKNDQGELLKNCWYAENLDKKVYVSMEYLENFPHVVKEYYEDGTYNPCKECLLGECVTVGRRKTIVDYCEDCLKDPDHGGLDRIMHKMGCLVSYTMGQAYGNPIFTERNKELQRPACAINFVRSYILSRAPQLEDEQFDYGLDNFARHPDEFEFEHTPTDAQNDAAWGL